MKKVQYILISILLLLVIVVLSLFLIQGIDYALHFKTYSQIDKFFGNMKDLRLKDKCYDDYSKILNVKFKKQAITSKSILKPKQKDSTQIVPFDVYNKAILSCTQYKKDLSDVTVPQNISEDKLILLKKAKESKIISIDLFLDELNNLKLCNGNLKCIEPDKKYNASNTDKLRLLREGNNAALEAQKRLSVNYYINLYQRNKVTKEIQKHTQGMPFN